MDCLDGGCSFVLPSHVWRFKGSVRLGALTHENSTRGFALFRSCCCPNPVSMVGIVEAVAGGERTAQWCQGGTVAACGLWPFVTGRACLRGNKVQHTARAHLRAHAHTHAVVAMVVFKYTD